jgi:hypothetical protein
VSLICWSIILLYWGVVMYRYEVDADGKFDLFFIDEEYDIKRHIAKINDEIHAKLICRYLNQTLQRILQDKDNNIENIEVETDNK